MSDKKYQTIVIEYEGNAIPLTGFGIPIMGRQVVRLAMGDEIQKANELDNLLSEADIVLGEDSEELIEITDDINQAMAVLKQAKDKLTAIVNTQ